MIQKLLIANRGEIACRIIRTARRMGVATVAVYSDADRDAKHVQLADTSVHIGGAAPAESYLNGERLIEAACSTGADAIHPGYGFLSENAGFARLCAKAGIVFVGPPVGAIETMGSKDEAKRQMEAVEVPLVPGYHGADQSPALLAAEAERIGYPVLLKAAAGGGGKGMRLVESAAGFDEALAAAQREASNAFNDDVMLVEKFVQQPRHVEIQVFCDSLGGAVYLFERDCSIQRRHQKIVEEAPAPGMTEQLRAAMGQAAINAARAIDYVGAGTVEFLLDPDGAFYFMEMNTRLQVEHPVTEMITGQDLVEWQLRVAAGEPLPLNQEQLQVNGHAIEVRLYAEDPANDFFPSTGTIQTWGEPAPQPWLRIDTGVGAGDRVGVEYDPMIAKLIVHGNDRAQACERLCQALFDFELVGLVSNLPFLYRIVAGQPFRQAQLSTGFLEAFDYLEPPALPATEAAIAALTAVHGLQSRPGASGGWRLNAPSRLYVDLQLNAELYDVVAETSDDGQWSVQLNGETVTLTASCTNAEILVDGEAGQQRRRLRRLQDEGSWRIEAADAWVDVRPATLTWASDEGGAGDGRIKAPMTGRIVSIPVSAGQQVAAGETVLILEAMKMETSVAAPVAGTVTAVHCSEGDLVDGGQVLVEIEATQADA